MEEVKLKSSFVIGVNEADVTLTLCLGGLGAGRTDPRLLIGCAIQVRPRLR
jgi:hypothetical protein